VDCQYLSNDLWPRKPDVEVVPDLRLREQEAIVRKGLFEHQKRKGGSAMQLSSSAFQQARSIPIRFTCDGENISPEFSWNGAPARTKSFALIMHDPDAPVVGGFTHWVLYNIPARIAELPSNLSQDDQVARACVQGKNDSGKIGYFGPCPPAGTHRYVVRLYALDAELNLQPGASRQQLQQAMRDHVLGQAELTGTYARSAQKVA
jgi:Raf kinase inhibitor-like YbhB/YbcL family protein